MRTLNRLKPWIAKLVLGGLILGAGFPLAPLTLARNFERHHGFHGQRFQPHHYGHNGFQHHRSPRFQHHHRSWRFDHHRSPRFQHYGYQPRHFSYYPYWGFPQPGYHSFSWDPWAGRWYVNPGYSYYYPPPPPVF